MPNPAPFPAGPGDNTQPVTWPAEHAHITLRNGQQGRYFGRCAITGRHRVGILSERHSTAERPIYDIWLLDDCGRNRCSPGPCERDFLPGAKVQS
jgi:hypothetical protein